MDAFRYMHEGKTEIYIPHLKIAVCSNWKAVRRDNIPIIQAQHPVFCPDSSRLDDPEYQAYCIKELKKYAIIQSRPLLQVDIEPIQVTHEFINIANELIKIYDEEERLQYLRVRVEKKIKSIYPSYPIGSFEDVQDKFVRGR